MQPSSAPLFVVTANRLRDGVVVWVGAGNGWVERVADAAVFDKSGLPAALEAAQKAAARQEVVGVYETGAKLVDGRPEPDTGRELIRAHGPTVRPDLGPQAA